MHNKPIGIQNMNKTLLCALLALTSLLCGCVTPKNITYMQGFDEGMAQTVREMTRMKVQPDDKLSIIVSAKDPELAQVFNLTIAQLRAGQSAKAASASNGQTAAFTVAPDGTINYPILGKLHVAGLDRVELASAIEQRLTAENLLKDPIVIVEFLNATVSLLGDVSSPGEYPIDRDNMTILQALGKAGDLQITGMRQNVLLVREENGKDVAYRLDLTDTETLMTSPAFYVQQNDVIYVEPNDTKKRQSTANGNTFLTPGFWLSIISFLTSMVVLILR